MSNKRFDDFLSGQAKKSEAEIDWVDRKNEWLSKLGELYQSIESHLKEYIQSNRISLSYRDIQLTEEFLGQYSVKTMHINVRKAEVELVPVGTLLIGARGRVDLVGPKGLIRFVLVDKSVSRPKIQIKIIPPPSRRGPIISQAPEIIEWVWRISTPPPSITYIELNQENFLNALVGVVDG